MKFKMEKQKKEKKKTCYIHLESFPELLSHGYHLEVKLKWRKRMSLKADPRLAAKDITSMTFRYLLIGCAVFQMRKGSQVKTPLGTLVETDLFEFSVVIYPTLKCIWKS